MSDNDPAKSGDSELPTLSTTQLGGLGAETGFENNDEKPPVRLSGFASLLLGLVSWVALLGPSAIAVAVFAVLLGLIAMRPSRQGKPTGILPAKIGITLAVAFAFCGAFLPLLKTNTLGSQAEEFALNYIEVINAGYDQFALELNKSYQNRFAPSMPLEEHYKALDPALATELDARPGDDLIREAGPDAQWVLDRPPRVFLQYGVEKTELVMTCPEVKSKLQFFMHYRVDSDDVGQWHVHLVQPHQELIISKGAL